MQTRPLTSLLAATIVLGGCAIASVTTQPASQRTATLSQPIRRVEAGVDKARLKANLSVLTGTTPMSKGQSIPERGSVEGRGLTKQYLTDTLKTMGYTVERHKYRNNGENVFVKLMAAKPTTEYILVGAHMDSVRNAGANDNGTGTVSVLEVARLLKSQEDRQVNVIIAWFDEEELGLVGSKHMARDFKSRGYNITSVHTIDMLGWDSDKDQTVEIEQPDGGLWDYYVMVNEKHGLKLPLKRTSSGSTDHVAFRNEGYTAVGLCEEWAGGDTTPYYHRKTDTLATVDFDYLAAGTRLLTAAVSDLSRNVGAPPATPRLPHNLFPGRDHCPPDSHQH